VCVSWTFLPNNWHCPPGSSQVNPVSKYCCTAGLHVFTAPVATKAVLISLQFKCTYLQTETADWHCHAAPCTCNPNKQHPEPATGFNGAVLVHPAPCTPAHAAQAHATPAFSPCGTCSSFVKCCLEVCQMLPAAAAAISATATNLCTSARAV
jgi:hypothetical protein